METATIRIRGISGVSTVRCRDGERQASNTNNIGSSEGGIVGRIRRNAKQFSRGKGRRNVGITGEALHRHCKRVRHVHGKTPINSNGIHSTPPPALGGCTLWCTTEPNEPALRNEYRDTSALRKEKQLARRLRNDDMVLKKHRDEGEAHLCH